MTADDIILHKLLSIEIKHLKFSAYNIDKDLNAIQYHDDVIINGYYNDNFNHPIYVNDVKWNKSIDYANE